MIQVCLKSCLKAGRLPNLQAGEDVNRLKALTFTPKQDKRFRLWQSMRCFNVRLHN